VTEKDDPSGELSKNVKPSSIPVFFVKNAGMVYIPEVELPVSMKSDIFCVSVSAHNVVGYKNNNAKYTVVIGAHHDHLGKRRNQGLPRTE
jgi:Iap family predicted aminopeptidase